MSDEKTILGRPITGDVDKRNFKPIEQWDAERLLADLDAVFAADPTIAGIQWKQYTPYFNDGDPCEFSADLNYDAVVAYDKLPTYWSWDEAYDENDETVRTSAISDFRDATYNYETRQYDYKLSDLPAAQAVVNLSDNFGHYEFVCREHFGEHSTVIATREGFNVEYYEHD